MALRHKFDRSKWMLMRERLRLTDPKPPRPEPDLSLRSAITQLFTKLDAQTGSSVHKIQAKWKMIAGETVADHSYPARLIDNVLYVDVDSSAWLAEIVRLYSDNIQRFLEKEFGRNAVKKVRYQVCPAKSFGRSGGVARD